MTDARDIIAAAWYTEDAAISVEDAIAIISDHRSAEHSGDCTKEPWCMRCYVDESFRHADGVLVALHVAGYRIVPVEDIRMVAFAHHQLLHRERARTLHGSSESDLLDNRIEGLCEDAGLDIREIHRAVVEGDE